MAVNPEWSLDWQRSGFIGHRNWFDCCAVAPWRPEGIQTHGRGVFQVPEQPSHRLPEEFGGNEWLVDELYERYQQDKNTVDAKWWPLFESFDWAAAHLPTGVPAAVGDGQSGHTRNARRSSAGAGRPAAPAPAPAPAAPPATSPAAAPAAPAKKAPATVARDGAKKTEAGHRRPAHSGPAAEERQGAHRTRGRRCLRPPRTGQGHRHQHGHQPRGAHRHQRPGHSGQAADRQPRCHQLQPGPRPRRQGLLHPPDRLRRHPGACPSSPP